MGKIKNYMEKKLQLIFFWNDNFILPQILVYSFNKIKY